MRVSAGMEIHIVVNAHFIVSVVSRKGEVIFMLLQQLKARLRAEFDAYRQYLATADITVEELLAKAYELTWKDEIVNLIECTPNSVRYTDDIVVWIMKEPNALDFLYNIWRHTDYLLTAEFADLFYDEICIRKDGAK